MKNQFAMLAAMAALAANDVDQKIIRKAKGGTYSGTTLTKKQAKKRKATKAARKARKKNRK